MHKGKYVFSQLLGFLDKDVFWQIELFFKWLKQHLTDRHYPSSRPVRFT